ncbi:MAG: AsmA family protein [Candidatus Cyclobacteriaceae bacterium M2_1C_046]
MKKFFIISGIILGILVLTLLLVPVIFKDDIRKAVDSALEKSLNADFVFDTEDFNVSLFKNFPNPSASLNNFGIVNRAPFEGELLFAVREMNVVISLQSLLFGDQIKIKGVELNEPKAFLTVLEDGTANFDIAIDEDIPTGTADTATVEYNIGIEEWQINNGEVVYEDYSIPFKLHLKNLEHRGGGDFTQDIIDMQTYSKADSVTISFDNTEYVSNKTAEINMELLISENYERYEFQENSVRINDFAFGFDGWLKMLENEAMDMDITFSSTDNTFKDLLSIVPGMYHEDFEELQAEGELSFNGMAKGVMDSISVPEFNLNLIVDNASFKYPDVEDSFSDINLNLQIENPGDSVENTRIALNNFNMSMGGKPIEGKLIVENLRNHPIDAYLKGNIDLNDINKVIPIEGTSYQGVLDVNLTANGIYDSIRQIMPEMDGKLTLSNGYIKSADFPVALENFNINATVSNPTGNFSDFVTRISEFNFIMEDEPFTGNLVVTNLNNITWDLAAKGKIDLEQLSQIMDLQDMQLKGMLAANIETKGNMEALDAERYGDLPTSGTATLTNFSYSDSEMPYSVSISEADASFNPQRMTLSKMNGQVGESDFNLSGYVSNYMDYALNDDGMLRGNFNLQSNNINLNEFMTDEETTPDTEEESATGVIEIPKNVDVTLNADVKKATMLDMEMRNINGNVAANNGIANMNNVNFDLLDGKFLINGSYDPTDIRNPKYNFDLNINELSVNEAFNQFEVVRNFAPIAENIRGKFSTDFSLTGFLTREMEPDLSTITGQGLIKLAQAALQDSKIIEGVTRLTKLENTDDVEIRNVKVDARIENGRLIVQPFDLTLLGYTSVIAGSTGIDGSIEYLVELKVPAEKATQALSQFSGVKIGKETIVLPVMVTGTFKDPQFGLKTEELKDELSDAAKEKAKEEMKEGAKDVLDDVVKDDKVKETIGGLLGGKKDTTTVKDTTQKADTTKNVQEKIEEEAKEKLKNLFPKKKKNDN